MPLTSPDTASEQAIQRIQIFGERCSGTNYLEQLLAGNLPGVSFTSGFGFKHFFPRMDADGSTDCLFVVIYRDPFDWLRSIYRNPWHAAPALKNIPFSEFIRQEWWCVWDEDAGIDAVDPRYGTEMMLERDPGTGRRFRNILAMRSAKIRAWESFRKAREHSLCINYERLRDTPEQVIRGLADEFGLAPANPFRPVKSYKGAKWYRGWREKLLRRRRPDISAADVDYILEQLDPELESAIGYDLYVGGVKTD